MVPLIFIASSQASGIIFTCTSYLSCMTTIFIRL